MDIAVLIVDGLTILTVLSGVRSVKRQFKKNRQRQAQLQQVVSHVRRVS